MFNTAGQVFAQGLELDVFSVLKWGCPHNRLLENIQFRLSLFDGDAGLETSDDLDHLCPRLRRRLTTGLILAESQGDENVHVERLGEAEMLWQDSDHFERFIIEFDGLSNDRSAPEPPRPSAMGQNGTRRPPGRSSSLRKPRSWSGCIPNSDKNSPDTRAVMIRSG